MGRKDVYTAEGKSCTLQAEISQYLWNNLRKTWHQELTDGNEGCFEERWKEVFPSNISESWP